MEGLFIRLKVLSNVDGNTGEGKDFFSLPLLRPSNESCRMTMVDGFLYCIFLSLNEGGKLGRKQQKRKSKVFFTFA